jgi:hypothetical protein
MVAETRSARLDLYARTKFVKEGREIEESRQLIEASCEVQESWHAVVERAAGQLSAGYESGDIEVG